MLSLVMDKFLYIKKFSLIWTKWISSN